MPKLNLAILNQSIIHYHHKLTDESIYEQSDYKNICNFQYVLFVLCFIKSAR